MLESVNEVAVLVTAVLAVAVGSVWYSPLAFGEIWMRSIGIEPGEDVMTKKEMYLSVAKGLVNQIIFFFVIALIAVRLDTSVSIWTLVGLLIVLIATQMYSSLLWERKKFSYFLVNIGYTSFILIAGLAIITFWPW